ncbi:MAG: DUF4160 domain-containing protein [Beijerinckiaceae bacterium]|nr:DUF4160 domain-containing protein [Beijerinckiaceae bacterium]
MPTVAAVDGIKILFYFDEHPPPHFHAEFAEFAAQIQIDPPKLLRGSLPPAKLAIVLRSGPNLASYANPLPRERVAGGAGRVRGCGLRTSGSRQPLIRRFAPPSPNGRRKNQRLSERAIAAN